MKETHIILRERALANSSIDAKMAEISELYGDYIEFLLSPNIFAIESSFVKEVFSLKEITPVPGTPGRRGSAPASRPARRRAS